MTALIICNYAGLKHTIHPIHEIKGKRVTLTICPLEYRKEVQVDFHINEVVII
jgi:hypothetical protein